MKSIYNRFLCAVFGRCTCLRPAAPFGDAAKAHKCVPCHKVGLMIAECVKRPLKDWAKA